MPVQPSREQWDAMTEQERQDYGRRQQDWSAQYFASIGGSGARIDEPITSPTSMNSDEFSTDYWNTPAVADMRVDSSDVPLGGGALGQSYIAPQSDYGQAADPTGALNLAAQTVTTNAAAGGTLLAASGDTQPIDAGQAGLTDWNQSLALALGDTVRQVVASAGQVATNAVNAGGQRLVAKVNPTQKTSVANTPKPSGMMMTPTTMLVLAAVVVGVIVIANKSHRAA